MRSPSTISIDDVHPGADAGEDGVVEVEAGIVDEVDEDLRVAGVGAARRDADRAADVHAADFVPHERAVAAVLVRARAAALDDEVRHDAVEREVVVVAAVDQRRGTCVRASGASIGIEA